MWRPLLLSHVMDNILSNLDVYTELPKWLIGLSLTDTTLFPTTQLYCSWAVDTTTPIYSFYSSLPFLDRSIHSPFDRGDQRPQSQVQLHFRCLPAVPEWRAAALITHYVWLCTSPMIFKDGVITAGWLFLTVPNFIEMTYEVYMNDRGYAKQPFTDYQLWALYRARCYSDELQLCYDGRQKMLGMHWGIGGWWDSLHYNINVSLW